MTSSARPTRVAQLAHRGVAGGLRQLPTVRSKDQRVVEERGWRRATQEAPEPDLGRRRMQQVTTADDEVDVLVQVVDHDREAVGPVAVPIADRRGRRRRPRRPRTARRPRPSRSRDRHRWATRSTGPSSPRSRHPPGQPGPVHGRPCVGGPRRERRARAVAAVDEALRAAAASRASRYGASESECRVGPRSAANPSHARSSIRAASYSGRDRTRS